MNAIELSPNSIEPADASTGHANPRPRSTFVSGKIQAHHLKRMADVYVRQSSPQQVLDNRESTARQYALVDRAVDLGWPRAQVQVIDEDQGRSGSTTEGRLGFQRLLAEVSLDRVGIILGLEMSRLARSCKDWHQLLELCAIFRTLLADQDGLYDPTDYNDRLLLGLKGTMSEAELHILKGRMNEGKLNKARRGELFIQVPTGYVKINSQQVGFDPDEQVRATVHMVFAKFEELGSVAGVLKHFAKHGIKLGVRPHDGPNPGILTWRRPCRTTLASILRNPIYAGAYTYGRSQVDPRRRRDGKINSGRRFVPLEQWHALRREQLPAYISWNQYIANQRRLDQNRALISAMGAPREGQSLLTGLLVCGTCGGRMMVNYKDRSYGHKYVCMREKLDFGTDFCQVIPGNLVDGLVATQLLQVLQPEPLQLSMQVADDLQQERARLGLNWRQQLERARFESRKAEKHYRTVDPENRLVARTLEQQWEEALRQERQVEDDFRRFEQERPCELTSADRERILALASDVPTLWKSPLTNPADRKQIVRHLVEKVVMTVRNKTEYMDVTIHWVGGYISQHETIRSVASYRQLRDFEQLKKRLFELGDAGYRQADIAEVLNQEGFRPAKLRTTFNKNTVRELFKRLGRVGPCSWGKDRRKLKSDEWWLSDLAKKLGMPTTTIHSWIHRGWLHATKESGAVGCWVCWADANELARLRRLYGCPRGNSLHQPYPKELTTPRPRTCSHDANNRK